MNLSIAIIGTRKTFCNECKFLAAIEIRDSHAINSPIHLCTKHANEALVKLEQCLMEIAHG